MKIIEIVGNQHLRILALEETLGRLQNENSQLKEKLLTSKPTATEVLVKLVKPEEPTP